MIPNLLLFFISSRDLAQVKVGRANQQQERSEISLMVPICPASDLCQYCAEHFTCTVASEAFCEAYHFLICSSKTDVGTEASLNRAMLTQLA